MHTSLPPRRLLELGAVAIAAAGLVLFTGPAALAQEVTLDPESGLADGDTISVSASGLEDLDGQQAAVTQCGNADSDGNPIPAAEAEDEESFAANCFGADAIGTPQIVLVAVSGGTLSADYPVATSGIGANGATCIPTAEAELPCTIVVADLATQGQTVTVTAPFDVGEGEAEPAQEEEEETEEEPAEEEEELADTGIGLLPIALGSAGLAGTGSLILFTTRRRRSS